MLYISIKKHSCQLISYIFLAVFSITLAIPEPVQAKNIIKDAGFKARMVPIIAKIIEYKDSQNVNELLNTMLDLKTEIEAYTKTTFNIDTELAKIKGTLEEHGVYADLELKILGDAINAKTAKLKKTAKFLTDCLEDGSEITFAEPENLTMEYIQGSSPNARKLEDLPKQFTIGVMMMLSGNFLQTLGSKQRPLASAGEKMHAVGLELVINQSRSP